VHSRQAQRSSRFAASTSPSRRSFVAASEMEMISEMARRKVSGAAVWQEVAAAARPDAGGGEWCFGIGVVWEWGGWDGGLGFGYRTAKGGDLGKLRHGQSNLFRIQRESQCLLRQADLWVRSGRASFSAICPEPSLSDTRRRPFFLGNLRREVAAFDTRRPPSMLAADIPRRGSAGWAFWGKSTTVKLFPGSGV
jgi:hypothetical protein